MAWWLLLLITVGFQIVSGILSSLGKGAKPEKDIDLPDTDASAPICVPFGECLITGPQLWDYMDFKAIAIKIRNPTTLFITKLTIGYRYYLGMVFGLCHAGDFKVQPFAIYIDNREVWSDPGGVWLNQNSPIYINKPTHFGAQKQEGGVAATVHFLNGRDLTALGAPLISNAYWEDQRAMAMPHYKDIAYAVWHGPSFGIVALAPPITLSGYIGNAPRVWPISFKVGRYPEYFGGGAAVQPVANHANPVMCLYEVLTNSMFGAGISTDQFSVTGGAGNPGDWNYASNQVYLEGLGFSYLWTSASSVEEMAAEILRYIDGVMWTDLTSGLIKLKLVREEATSTEVNNTDFLEIKSFTRGSWEDTRNEVRVSFPDHSKVNFEESTATWFDGANFETQGASEAAEIHYRGCPSMAQAVKLAQRDGRVMATPLAKLSAVGDRQFWSWHPGMLFLFTWTEQGISQLPMRVTNVELGTIVDGRITINAVQDVFRAGDATFGNPDSTIWTDPLEADAEDAPHAAVGEIPHWMQRDDIPRVFGMAERPDSAHIAYDGALNGESDVLDADFTPTGTLAADLEQLADGGYNTTGFTVEAVEIDADQIEAGTTTTIPADGAGLALIGNPASDHEWIAFETVTDNEDGTVDLDNIWRGILDTPPRDWPAGTRVWFFSVSQAIFMTGLGNSQAITFEALTRTMRDQLLNSEATNYAYTTQRRAYRPLPPYYVRLGGSYTELVQETGDVELTWREHSRLVMPQILKQSHATEDPEAGVTYEVEIYDTDGAELRTETGLTDPEYTYTNADELSDSGESALEARLLFKIYSKRDGVRSLYPWERYVYRVDPDDFGNIVVVNGDTVTVDAEIVIQT